MLNKRLAGSTCATWAVLRAARRWGVLGVVLALAVLTVGRVSAQNLVPNPSFESYSAIPTAQDQLDLAVPWTSPTSSTPDYFHFLAASSSFVGVPGNMFGNQLAVTGQAYAGFHARPTNLYREYVETPLSSPLVAGQTYLISFYVSLADQSQWAVDKIGAYLSVGPVSLVSTLYTLPLSPQVSNPVGNFITDKTGWTAISGQYVAAGGEDHMVIGNFLDNPSTTPLVVGGAYPFAYYYLDDVSVTPAPCVQPPCGMVSWWPGDGNPNDIVDGNHGTLIGSAGYAPGVVDKAFILTVAGDCVEVPNAANLNFGPAGSVGGDLSIDAWILIPNGSPSLTATYLPIVDKRELPGGAWDPQSIGYFLFLYNGKLAFQLGDSTFDFYNYIDLLGTDLRDGAWHHVAVTVDRNSTTGGNLYVDGAVVLNFNPTNRPGDLTNSDPLFIGRHAGAPSTSFIGLIDEVEIFNRVLSPLEVWDIFNAKSAGKCKCYGGLDLTISTGEYGQWLVAAVPSGSTMQVGPAPLVSSLPSSWQQPSATYIAWVGTPGSGTATPGTYIYEYKFCLCDGYSNVQIKFSLWADESAVVFLNGGVPLPWTPPLPSSWMYGSGHLIDVSSGFVVGVNTLQIVVSKNSTGPSGMMVSGWIGADVGRCCP